MSLQGGIIIALLSALVAIGVIDAIADSDPADDAASTGFSVTPIGAGQYVMRAADKIFFCKGNQCTGIKLIATPAAQPAAQQPEVQPAQPSE